MITNSSDGEVSSEMIFEYKQENQIVSCSYSGGGIVKGHLIATVDIDGCLAMNYHQVNSQGVLKTGKCFSTPELMPNGKLRLHEKWEWTSGDEGEGVSILEEV